MIQEALFLAYSLRQELGTQREGGPPGQTAPGAAQDRSQIDLLQLEIERLLMVTEALWILLRDQHGFTDELLIQKVQEIDLRDGRRDGRVAKEPPMKCPQCGKAIGARRPICIFCGAASPVSPFAR
jgi:hypothetical protein